MTLARRCGLRRTSPRRDADQDVRRRLSAGYEHAACRLLTPVCTGRAEAFHELVGRAQTGSIVDPRNLTPACNRCNSWCEDNPADAYVLGIKVRSHDAAPGERGLVPAEPHPLAIAWDAGGDAWT